MSRLRYRTIPCETCRGEGHVTEFHTYAGEAFAGEPVDLLCPDCEGCGAQAESCVECGRIEPLDAEGECERCHDAHELTLADFNYKYGLTETHGDPLPRKDAA
jgi:hypothetical protein